MSVCDEARKGNSAALKKLLEAGGNADSMVSIKLFYLSLVFSILSELS